MSILHRGNMAFDVPSYDERGDGWTEDCGHKMDYDPNIVSLSSRAYADGTYISSVYIGEEQVSTTGLVHTESQADAMRAVEAWSEVQAEKIAMAVRAALS